MKLILNRPTTRPFKSIQAGEWDGTIHRPGAKTSFKLIQRVFAYHGGYRWIVTDETTAGYGGVVAHGRRRRYMEARAEAAKRIQRLEGKV